MRIAFFPDRFSFGGLFFAKISQNHIIRLPKIKI